MARFNIFLCAGCVLWLASSDRCVELQPETHGLEVHNETCQREDPGVTLLQMASILSQDWKTQQTARQLFLEQLSASNSAKTLAWRTLRRFPAQSRSRDPQCANIGSRFPILTSRNQSVLERYREYACHTAPDYFVTDPDVTLTTEVAEMENGCINLAAQPKVVLATNGSHRFDAYRLCTGSCLEDPGWKDLLVQVLDENLLVLPSLRTPPGMHYQHALSDLLPEAWSVKALLGDSKLVIHSPVHAGLLGSLGIPEKHLLHIPLTDLDQQLLCVGPGRALTLWRTGREDGAALPTLDYADPRIFADYWWRLPAYRLAPELSDGIATAAGWSDSEPGGSVVFLQRCTEQRRLVNEQEALAATSAALVASLGDFHLLSFCPGREDFLQQVRTIRQARLIIGEHGGAMANMLLSRKGTGIIELVGSPEAQEGLEGEWPPYKSLWYGGAGAAFEFYRVVLYEASEERALRVRLEDLQEAVQQWLRAA